MNRTILLTCLLLLNIAPIECMKKKDNNNNKRKTYYALKAKGIGAGALSGFYFLLAIGALGIGIQDLGDTLTNDESETNQSTTDTLKKLVKHAFVDIGAACGFLYSAIEMANYSNDKFQAAGKIKI